MRILWFVLTTIALLAAAAGGLVFALLPPRLVPPPQTDFALSDVTVINPGQARAEHQTIVVRDGRIAEIREARADDPAPLCKGCFVIPGLSDAHVHTPPEIALGNQRLFALLYLAHGVTSVRDVAQSDDSIADWARRVNAGEEVGPHIYRCGPVVDGVEPGWPSALSVLTPDEGRAAVEKLAADGVNCIKTYNHVDRPTFDAMSATAARLGLPMIGHVPHKVGLAGVKDFESHHLTGLPYVHRAPPWPTDIESADLARMTDAEIDEALNLAAARGVALVPTIVNLATRLMASDPKRFPPAKAAALLPDFWSKVWPVIVGHPDGDEAIEAQLNAIARSRDIVRKARAKGIDVLAGTDTLMPWTVPGEAMLREIDELAVAFGDNDAALASATAVNGAHFDRTNIGKIAPGMRADLLVLPDDPTANLEALKQWRLVIAHGRRYDRATIDAWVEQYRTHFHGPVYTWVFGIVADQLTGSYRTNLRETRE